MPAGPLFEPLTLPNGTVLPNRVAKAAMEENLATPDHAPGEALERIYRAWAAGGAGLLLTGNVMIDARAMTGPGGVVVEDRRHLPSLRRWAEAGRAGGGQFWMQINHPGRQMRADLGQDTVAPSEVPLALGRFSRMFSTPRAMTQADIEAVIARFARTARIAEEAGFTGVEIHAAHGYLLNQFLSPLTNRRSDIWGGSAAHRARLLLEVVEAVRAAVGRGFCVGVKLNSADFQRGGFDVDDALAVVARLNDLGIDLLEISGGSFESPAMQGRAADERTLAREAYFLEFATMIGRAAAMPVMLTGGIRSRPVAERALAEGIAVVGMATALALDPGLPNRWRRGEAAEVAAPRVGWRSKALASLAVRSMVDAQLRRLSRGQRPRRCAWPALTLLQGQIRFARQTKRYRAWSQRRAGSGSSS